MPASLQTGNLSLFKNYMTFGVLKFSVLRREVHIQNEDGTVSEEIKEHTYYLKCKEQGYMIQVSIPANVPLKEFD